VRFLLLPALLFTFYLVNGQSNQAEFLEAKRQFGLGNFAAAKLGFESLTKDEAFGAYASFYYALSAYKNGETKLAYDMWRQVGINHPSWNQANEVNYWLATSAFELKRYRAGFGYLKALPEDLKVLVVEGSLHTKSLEELTQAYKLNPDNMALGAYIVDAMMELPFGERDMDLINQIAKEHDLAVVGLQSGLPEIKKEKYAIALVLPFMFESIDKPQAVLRNSLIWNLYEGMQFAKTDLEMLGVEVELFPFDTKKSEAATQGIVESGVLDDADVIIGPLFAGPNQVISDFSLSEEKVTINPLSYNTGVIGNNPFSYLFKPSYEAQGRAAARFASESFVENKKALVYYETQRDSIVARIYLDELEKSGFFIAQFEQLTKEGALQVQKDFTEKYEVRLDNKFDNEEIDSIRLVPGRIVKTRLLRKKNSGALIKDDEGNPINEYYEERFTVKDDSIGHIFVATSNNLYANNFISIAEVRSDTIGVIGYDSWLNFTTITYNQLERLGIAFISPSLFKKQTPAYNSLKDSFIKKIGREPGEYHIFGYELVYQLGLLLEEYGKHFQKGLGSDRLIEGKVMSGLKYGVYNDNQVVPITKLENLELVDQTNKKTDED